MEPYKRYSQLVSKAFHISNAAIDVCTGDNDICQVMVGSDGKDFLVCTLQKGKTLQTHLDLYFKEGNQISFTSSGTLEFFNTIFFLFFELVSPRFFF